LLQVLQFAATGCNWLQLAATGCNWLQPAVTGCNWPQLVRLGATGCDCCDEIWADTQVSPTMYDWVQFAATGRNRVQEGAAGMWQKETKRRRAQVGCNLLQLAAICCKGTREGPIFDFHISWGIHTCPVEIEVFELECVNFTQGGGWRCLRVNTVLR
jgi:hypothetical protein